MKNGAIGSVHLDYNQQPPSHRWEIVGSKGTMKWDNASGNLDVFSAEKKDWVAYQPPAGFERNVMFIEEMKHFIQVVQKKETARLHAERWETSFAAGIGRARVQWKRNFSKIGLGDPLE